MKRLFVHHPFFRLLSPFFSGVIIYLLILLLNNNIQQILEEFFNQELYFCIALSYLIQEFSRILLLIFKKYTNEISIVNILIQVSVSIALCILFSSLAIYLYFEYILGFSASEEEIYIFNSIFCFVMFMYIVLYVSHQYLYKVNSKKLQQQELIKKNIEEDFKQFKREINPELLFESFEHIISLLKIEPEKSDDFIDNLASVYRYLLSSKEKQLTNFFKEALASKHLVQTLNALPFRTVTLNTSITSKFLVVPGILLRIIELIAKSSIPSKKLTIKIDVKESEDNFSITYLTHNKINKEFTLNDLEDFSNSYNIYSSQQINIEESRGQKTITLPKLNLKY